MKMLLRRVNAAVATPTEPTSATAPDGRVLQTNILLRKTTGGALERAVGTRKLKRRGAAVRLLPMLLMPGAATSAAVTTVAVAHKASVINAATSRVAVRTGSVHEPSPGRGRRIRSSHGA